MADQEPSGDLEVSTRTRDGQPAVSSRHAHEAARELELARAAAADDALRARADLENLRRRSAQERERAAASTTERVLREIMPVFENLARALQAANAATSASPESLVAGLQMIERDLDGALQRLGIERFGAAGETFDPTRHDAAAVRPGGDAMVIAEIVAPGLRLGDRVLKAATVVVFQGS